MKPLRFCYADPPYPGQGKRYEHKKEVNHRLLIQYLTTFDGWALSTSSPALRDLLPLCPPKTRVAAWCKPFVPFRPGIWPSYSWEPVLFQRGRFPGRDRQTPHDSLMTDSMRYNGSRGTNFTGSKPPEFCGWLFDMLGMEPEDDFEDIFPGTGAVTKAWEQWKTVRMCGGPLFADSSRPLLPAAEQEKLSG